MVVDPTKLKEKVKIKQRNLFSDNNNIFILLEFCGHIIYVIYERNYYSFEENHYHRLT